MTELTRDQQTRIVAVVATELAAVRDAALAAGATPAAVAEAIERRTRAVRRSRART